VTIYFYDNAESTNVRTSLDVDIKQDRPLLLYHPACDRNYTSSWQLLLDIGHEFIQICNDRWPAYPENLMNESGFQYWTRMGDMNKYDGQVYHRSEESINHRQIHVEGCASEVLATLPLVDIYYDDYPCVMFNQQNPTLTQYLDTICESVVDGGLLIFDMKNFKFSSNNKNLAYQLRYENNDNRVQFLGEAEWMNLADVAVIKTTEVMVFKIHHKATKTLNFSEWIKGVIPEYTCQSWHFDRLSHQVNPRFSHIHSVDSEYYLQIWNNHLEYGSPLWSNYPAKVIDKEDYIEEAKSLNRGTTKCLSDDFLKHEKKPGIKTVKADIFNHLHWLWLNNYTVILRDKHFRKAARICPMLEHRLVSITKQTESNSLKNSELIWSGAHSNVLSAIMNLAKSESMSKVATIVFGNGSIPKLPNSRGFDELLIFHIDDLD